LPIVEVDDVKAALTFLKKKNIKTVASSLAAQKNYFEVDYKGGVVIVVIAGLIFNYFWFKNTFNYRNFQLLGGILEGFV